MLLSIHGSVRSGLIYPDLVGYYVGVTKYVTNENVWRTNVSGLKRNWTSSLATIVSDVVNDRSLMTESVVNDMCLVLNGSLHRPIATSVADGPIAVR